MLYLVLQKGTKMKTFEETLKDLYEYAQSIGMDVYFDSENPEFGGFIIGTPDFFDAVVSGEEDFGNYDMVTGVEYKDNNDRGDLH